MQCLKTTIILFTLFILFISNTASSQTTDQRTSEESLNKEILRMDSLLFEEAFNKCNLDLFKTLIAEDIEFYDDRSGLSKSLQNEIPPFKDRCSKPYSVTRKLVKSYASILGDYGAVQMGEHEFYVDGTKVEKGKFITIWERKGATWIVKRAISYEHEAIENED